MTLIGQHADDQDETAGADAVVHHLIDLTAHPQILYAMAEHDEAQMLMLDGHSFFMSADQATTRRRQFCHRERRQIGREKVAASGRAELEPHEP